MSTDGFSFRLYFKGTAPCKPTKSYRTSDFECVRQIVFAKGPILQTDKTNKQLAFLCQWKPLLNIIPDLVVGIPIFDLSGRVLSVVGLAFKRKLPQGFFERKLPNLRELLEVFVPYALLDQGTTDNGDDVARITSVLEVVEAVEKVTSSNPEVALTEIGAATSRLTGCKNVVIFSVNSDDARLRKFRTSFGNSEKAGCPNLKIHSMEDIPLSDKNIAALAWVAKHKKGMKINNPSELTEFGIHSNQIHTVGRCNAKSMLIVPIIDYSGESPLVIEVSDKENGFSPQEFEAVLLFCQHTACLLTCSILLHQIEKDLRRQNIMQEMLCNLTSVNPDQPNACLFRGGFDEYHLLTDFIPRRDNVDFARGQREKYTSDEYSDEYADDYEYEEKPEEVRKEQQAALPAKPQGREQTKQYYDVGQNNKYTAPPQQFYLQPHPEQGRVRQRYEANKISPEAEQLPIGNGQAKNFDGDRRRQPEARKFQLDTRTEGQETYSPDRGHLTENAKVQQDIPARIYGMLRTRGQGEQGYRYTDTLTEQRDYQTNFTHPEGGHHQYERSFPPENEHPDRTSNPRPGYGDHYGHVGYPVAYENHNILHQNTSTYNHGKGHHQDQGGYHGPPHPHHYAETHHHDNRHHETHHHDNRHHENRHHDTHHHENRHHENRHHDTHHHDNRHHDTRHHDYRHHDNHHHDNRHHGTHHHDNHHHDNRHHGTHHHDNHHHDNRHHGTHHHDNRHHDNRHHETHHYDNRHHGPHHHENRHHETHHHDNRHHGTHYY